MLNSIANGISGSLGSYVMELLYRMPAILVALAFHEWAHAYAAYKLGDPTAYNLGRMTLNPLAHIDLIGLIMMMLVRFGWAKPVPVSTRNFKHPRRDEIIVSLAGVAQHRSKAVYVPAEVRLCDTYSAAYDQLAGRHYVIRSELPDVRNDEHMCSHIRPVRADVTWHTR